MEEGEEEGLGEVGPEEEGEGYEEGEEGCCEQAGGEEGVEVAVPGEVDEALVVTWVLKRWREEGTNGTWCTLNG